MEKPVRIEEEKRSRAWIIQAHRKVNPMPLRFKPNHLYMAINMALSHMKAGDLLEIKGLYDEAISLRVETAEDEPFEGEGSNMQFGS